MRTCVLCNPRANNGKGDQAKEAVRAALAGKDLEFINVIGLDYRALLAELTEEDEVILVGGDGTLNFFVNAIGDEPLRPSVYTFPAGSGNDFAKDLGIEPGTLSERINVYLENLPTVTVNGETQRFLNGIGYGIDGYCCEVGDQLRETSEKPVNYAGIAIKGLLFHYKPTLASVTVDGKAFSYPKTWLAPSMNGRYYGGGMEVAPRQDRLNPERRLSLVIMHGSGKLKTLIVFPSIFKGEHVKHEEMVAVHEGREIRVAFDRPVALQIDGETRLNVTEYTVRAAAVCAREEAKAAPQTV